jgi:dihydroflavonol-4-reductase
MTAFLTGGTGFIGSHVARALVADGEHVRCLTRPGSPAANLDGVDVERIDGDVRDLPSVRRGMAGCELVFHCAADYRLYAAEPRELYETNVGGTCNVLRAAADVAPRCVVYTSSVGTLTPAADGTPADETAVGALADMAGDYKRSKLLAEREALRWAGRGLPVVTVVPSTPVGERDVKPTPTGQIIVDFLRRRMPAYVDTGLNLVDVRDVAAGHLLAAERGQAGQRYILANQNVTLRELLGILARLTGLPAPTVRLPHWLPLAIAHVEAALARWGRRPPRVPLEAARMARKKMFFDGGKAVRELGVPQSPVEDALSRAVIWFGEHGYAPRPATAVREALA